MSLIAILAARTTRVESIVSGWSLARFPEPTEPVEYLSERFVEPFAIQCPTCQSRLRVNKPEAIGQIVRCPRCGGMVMIQPPVPAAAGPEDVDRRQPKGGRAAAAGGTAVLGDALGRSFDHVNDLLEDHQTSAPPESPAESPTQPMPPNADWTSSGWHAYRAWVIGSGVGLVTLCAVAGGIHQFLISRDHSAPQLSATPISEVAHANDARSAEVDGPNTAPRVADDNRKPSVDAVRDRKTPVPQDPPEASTHRDAQDLPPADRGTEELVPSTAPPVAASETFAASEPVADEPVADEPEAAPREVAASEVAPDETPAPAHVPSAFVAPRQGAAVRDLFQEYTSLADGELTPNEMSLSPPDNGDGNASELVSILTDDPAYVLPSDRVRDPVIQHHLANRLKDPIAQIHVEQLPLRSFLVFFTELTTVPVTIPADVVLRNRLSLDLPVTVKSKSLTAEEMLSAAIAPLNLATDTTTGQLRLKTRSEDGEQIQRIVYDVSELLSGAIAPPEAASRDLADQCLRLTGIDNWQAYQGPCEMQVYGAQWTVRASDAVHFELELALEHIRLARGLPRKTDFPDRWFGQVSRLRRAQPALQEKVTLRSVQLVPLYQVLERISQQAGCDLFVDWEALARAGWAHDTPISLSVEQMPLADALAKLLAPMRLVYRAIDDKALQITTRQAEMEHFELESFALPAGANRNASRVQQDIFQLVGLGQFHAGGGRGHVYVDTANATVLVRLPQSDQLVVDRFLND